MSHPPAGQSGRSNRGLLGSPVRLAILAAGVLVLAVAAYGGWYLFLRPAGPPPVDIATLPLASPTPAATVAAPSAIPASGTASTSTSPSAAPSATTGAGSASLDGTWKVDPSIGSGDTGSFVGYRVQEQLAGIGANTAVGRTAAVTGTFTLAGSSIAAATFTADLTGLRSDDQRRDGVLRRQGLETDTFPTATFTLSTPIDLGSAPADGAIVSVQATGQLALHGQTRSVHVPLKARLSGGVIAVTGSLPITFADYGIQAPTSFAVLSIANQGTMELQLMFARG